MMFRMMFEMMFIIEDLNVLKAGHTLLSFSILLITICVIHYHLIHYFRNLP